MEMVSGGFIKGRRRRAPPLIGEQISDSKSWDQELSNGIWLIKIRPAVQKLLVHKMTLQSCSELSS